MKYRKFDSQIPKTREINFQGEKGSFFRTACGRPQGGGGQAHVDTCVQRKGDQKPDFVVDVINGWLLRAHENEVPASTALRFLGLHMLQKVCYILCETPTV